MGGRGETSCRGWPRNEQIWNVFDRGANLVPAEPAGVLLGWVTEIPLPGSEKQPGRPVRLRAGGPRRSQRPRGPWFVRPDDGLWSSDPGPGGAAFHPEVPANTGKSRCVPSSAAAGHAPGPHVPGGPGSSRLSPAPASGGGTFVSLAARTDPLTRAREWRRLIDTGAVKNAAALARRHGVTRARVSRLLSPLRATKNYQLDLFDPNDGHYEYSAVTSNLALTVRNLWYFACGRGNHEKTIAQLKTGLAFHSVPTQTYAANSAWQQLVVLAHNLLTNFQLETGAPARRRTRKHTVVPLLRSVQTLRFELFHRAALLVRPGGRARLRMTDNLPTRQTFTRIANALASG